MQHRRRSKQTITLKDRLTAWADEVRERAKKLPPVKSAIPCSRKQVRPTRRLI